MDAMSRAAISLVQSLQRDSALALADSLDGGQLPRGDITTILQTTYGAPHLVALGLAGLVKAARGAGEHADARLAAGVRVALTMEKPVASPSVELVWTGPRAPRLRQRATYSVALELLRGARTEVIVVGYSLTSGATTILEEFARAGARGVHLSLVGQRLSYMLKPLLAAWPLAQRLPDLYTFEPSKEDPRAALHAKLIIVDRSSMLVTSANLTFHGLHGNIEVGVLCQGAVAEATVQLLLSWVSRGVLRPLAAPPRAA
jgi:phosphatidylserine/phosphatidylglycerophosphate/cardiolipin synthase-like enzyme